MPACRRHLPTSFGTLRRPLPSLWCIWWIVYDSATPSRRCSAGSAAAAAAGIGARKAQEALHGSREILQKVRDSGAGGLRRAAPLSAALQRSAHAVSGISIPTSNAYGVAENERPEVGMVRAPCLTGYIPTRVLTPVSATRRVFASGSTQHNFPTRRNIFRRLKHLLSRPTRRNRR